MRTGVNDRSDLPIALVIGGGGMGMSTARRLGQSHRIILASLTADKNPKREELLREDGIDATVTQCDITDPESVADLGRFVAERGQLRTLAHVAALSPATGDWRTVLTANLIGVTHIERMCLGLATQGTAAIFVSSLAAHRSDPPSDEIISVLDDPLAPDFFERLEALVPEQESVLAYRLSKFSVNRMCRRRASEWGARGARIVSMSPGLIATPMGAREFSGQSGELKRELLRSTPLQREGTMVETADAIEFLASERASFITGTDLLVDGGTLAAVR
ncbi:SDR family oxidoreductase [Rhodococcus sp. CX]|uniref:SDR family oxidoreductase n=1 Tax=Rhodococcus sp. CX TaxID=2789880 RepID=UPI0018CFCAA9|nr:SDR family oxidoreductase [Rhodococcus sp. CX]MBH0118404.1 SDR family oxidoreductase [Rhodococcus sp. CX]